jgi:hypothetical protein
VSRPVLDRVVSRAPLGEHDGRSGSLLERLVLDDGTRLIAKRVSPATDLAMRATGDADGREWRLWSAGVLDRLPSGVEHAIVDAWREGGETVVVMRDVSDAVVGWTRRLSRAECRRVLGAAAALYDAFSGEPVEGLCPVDVRLTLLSPRRMAPYLDGSNPLPALVTRGWERFADLAPDPAAEAVLRLLEDPAPLVAQLARYERTLLHGDLWLVNLGLRPDRVVLLDWGVATWAPPAIELGSFLAGNASQVDATPEQIVADFSDLAGRWADPGAVRLGLVAGVMELAWNKALDAAEHPDPAKRARERADLAWWLRAAEPGLAAL